MLEYWIQVELFRAIESGVAGSWRHVGEYEQPYYTRVPRPGTKTNIKWVDLLLAEPTLVRPSRVAWVELKDLGRNEHTAEANTRGLAYDLAALWGIDLEKTVQVWLDPPEHVIDAGRTEEWKSLASGLGHAMHLVSQVVLADKHLLRSVGEGLTEQRWLEAFRRRVGAQDSPPVSIGRCDTACFTVLSVVVRPMGPPNQVGQNA